MSDQTAGVLPIEQLEVTTTKGHVTLSNAGAKSYPGGSYFLIVPTLPNSTHLSWAQG